MIWLTFAIYFVFVFLNDQKIEKTRLNIIKNDNSLIFNQSSTFIKKENPIGSGKYQFMTLDSSPFPNEDNTLQKDIFYQQKKRSNFFVIFFSFLITSLHWFKS